MLYSRWVEGGQEEGIKKRQVAEGVGEVEQEGGDFKCFIYIFK